MQLLSRNKWQQYLSNNTTPAKPNTKRKTQGTSQNTALEAILTGSDPLLDVRVLQATCPYLYGLHFAPTYTPDENVETKTRDTRQEGTMAAANDDVLLEILRFCSDEELGQSVAPTCSRMRKVIGGLSFLRAMTGPKFADSIARSLEEQAEQDDAMGNSTSSPDQVKNAKREQFEQQRDWPARLAGDLTQVRDMLRDAITESNVAQMKNKRDSLPPAESFVLRLCEAVPDVVVRLDLVITALTIGTEMEQHRRDLDLVCDACDLLMASPTTNQELLAESQQFGLTAGLVTAVLLLGNTLNSRRGAGSAPPARAVDLESVLNVVKSLRSRFDSEFTGVEQLVLEMRELFDWDAAAEDASLHVAASALETVAGNRFNPPHMQSKFNASQSAVSRARRDAQRCKDAEMAFTQQQSSNAEENEYAHVHVSREDINRAAFFEQMGMLLRLVAPKANHLDSTLQRAREKYQALLTYVGGYGALQGLTRLACECKNRVGPKMAPIEFVRASALDNIALEKNAIGESAANAASKRGRKAKGGAVAKAFQQARDNVVKLTSRHKNAAQVRRQERRLEIEAEINGAVSEEHRESTAARLQRMLGRRLGASEKRQRNVGVHAEIREAMTDERREQVAAGLDGLLSAQQGTRDVIVADGVQDEEHTTDVKEDVKVLFQESELEDQEQMTDVKDAFKMLLQEIKKEDEDESAADESEGDEQQQNALVANLESTNLEANLTSLSSSSESDTSNEGAGAGAYADEGASDDAVSDEIVSDKEEEQNQQQDKQEQQQKPNTPLSKSVNWTVLTSGGETAALWDDVAMVLATEQARVTQEATLDEATLMLFSTGPHIALSRAARSKMKMLHFTSDHFQGISGATIGNNVRRDMANAVLRKTVGGGGAAIRRNNNNNNNNSVAAVNSAGSGLTMSVTPPPGEGEVSSSGNGSIGSDGGEEEKEDVAVVHQSFSLGELQQVASGSVEGVVSVVVASVDRAALESHLGDEDFETCFEMSRDKFNGLAKWRRDSLKRNAKLF